MWPPWGGAPPFPKTNEGCRIGPPPLRPNGRPAGRPPLTERLQGRRGRAPRGRVRPMSIWAAITLSVVATCCYQVGMVMQKVAADRMPRLGLTLRQWEVYGAFLRSPTWLGGLGVTIAGWAFFLKAIDNAPV